MKTITVDLTIRVTMIVPETMDTGEAVSEIGYDVFGDEDDVIAVESTEIIDFEEIG